MINQIEGLHHITSIAANAVENNAFFTEVLGLRRIKKTVNFDVPDVYHLYYGNAAGTPGSVMTYFPFPNVIKGQQGTGEVGQTVFSVPEGALDFWKKRFEDFNVKNVREGCLFGESRLNFTNTDGENFALAEVSDDERPAWTGNGVSQDQAIRGFYSASMRLQDDGATSELLEYMGYQKVDEAGNVKRFSVENGSGANFIEIETLPQMGRSREGAGSVHHLAFSVENRDTQLKVRKALLDTGYAVTPVIDRDYFWSVYFRAPGGVLFEVATNEPGFDHDEDMAHLGELLKLPKQHEHLRIMLEQQLQPLEVHGSSLSG